MIKEICDRVLSLDELYELLKAPQQAELLAKWNDPDYFEFDEQTHLHYPSMYMSLSKIEDNLLKHILVEEWTQNPSSVNWELALDCHNEEDIALLEYLFVNPLQWKDTTDNFSFYSIGDIAMEKYASIRMAMPKIWLWDLKIKPVLDFVDTFDNDPVEVLDENGLHFWPFLWTDYENFYHTSNKNDIVDFSTKALKFNIEKIVEERGGATAAKIIRALQRDWHTILYWNYFDLNKVSPETIKIFKQGLFHGFEAELIEWEKDLQGYDIDSDKPDPKKLEKIFTTLFRKQTAYSLMLDFLVKEKNREKDDTEADIDWKRHALVIYDHRNSVLQNSRNLTFKQWLKDFCDLFGRKEVEYTDPNKLCRSKKKSHVENYMTFDSVR